MKESLTKVAHCYMTIFNSICLTAIPQALFGFVLLALPLFSWGTGTASPLIDTEKHAPAVYFDLSLKESYSELLIIFDSKNSPHDYFLLDNPSRFVIDIHNTTLPEKVVGVPVKRPELERLRIAQDNKNVRFVLDLPSTLPVTHRVEEHPRGIKVSIFQHGNQRPTPATSLNHSTNSSGIMPQTTMDKEHPPAENQPDGLLVKLLGSEKITILFHKIPLEHFFSYISRKSGVAINSGTELSGALSLQLTETPLHEAVRLVMAQHNLKVSEENGGLFITSAIEQGID